MFSQIRTILIGCIILIASGCVFSQATEEDLLAVYEAANNALNAHDVDTMMSFWADDIVYDYVAAPPPADGKEEVAAFFGAIFQGFPDFHVEQRRILAAGNNLVTECTVTATHSGEWMGIPATGNGIQSIHMDVLEFEGDKLVHLTTYDDSVSFLVQIGLIPAPKLDPALLVPSFTLPEAEPTGLSPLEADAEARSRWNTHDLSVYAKVVHPDAEILIGPLGLTLSREAYIASQELYFFGFPDLRMETVRSIDMGGGWVLNEVLWKGTHTGLYFDILATGRPIEIRGAFLSRYDADGLLTNLNAYFDNLTILTQLGLFPPPNPEANKAIDRRVLEEIWNQGNLDVADEFYDTNFIYHITGIPDVQGPEGVKQVVAMYRTAFPDLQFTEEDMIAEADKVALLWTATGTHNGEFMGIPATGNQITLTGISFGCFAGGKFVEEWSSYDALGLMEQLGAAPVTHTSYAWGAPSEVTGDPGNPVANTALVLYVTEKFWNQKNVNVLDATHSPDSIGHNPVIPGGPLPFYVYKQVALIHISAFPDMRVATEDIIAEGDKVAIRWTTTGTHQGELMGIPATGRQVTWSGITIYRFADGKIVETWWAYDAMGMMQQITAQTIPEGLVVDQISSPSLENNLLGDPSTREVIIYLPPSYDQGGNFPVVYLLHGFTGNARTYASDAYTGMYWPAENDFPEGGIYGLLNDLIAAGTLEEMIIVMPDASNAYGGSWYTNSELTGNYEDYIVNDVISYIDNHYNTIPNQNSRAIVGHSMGGYGAMKLAMKHPDVFGAVASHGGALYFGAFKALIPAVVGENPAGMTGPAPDKPMTCVAYAMSAAFSPNFANPPFFVDLPFEYPSPEIIDHVWNRFMEHDVLTILGTIGTNVASLRGIYMDAGDQDEFGCNFQTDAFHQALDAAGIEHEYQIYTGTHFDRLFEKLTISLKFLSDALGD